MMKLASMVERIVGVGFAFAALVAAVVRQVVVADTELAEEAAVRIAELAEAAFVAVQAVAAHKALAFADNKQLLAAVDRTSSSFAYRQAPNMVLESAVDSSVVEMYRIHPSAALHQCNNSPSHSPPRDQVQMVDSGTYPNAGAHHIGSNCKLLPSSLPTFGHSISPP